MADVFISYSRKDIAFVRLIDEALQTGKFKTWVDWANSPAREHWWDEHFKAIETADVFLLVVSKNSLASKECREEAMTAFQHHKRVIPIVVDDSGDAEIAEFLPDVTKINWIIFRKGSTFQLEEQAQGSEDLEDDQWIASPREPEFSQVLEKLNQAIQMDWGWVRVHTRLQNKALEWERKMLESGFLLSGKDLREAEQLFAAAGDKKDPQPTGLQRKYLLESRRNESRKQRRLFIFIIIGLVVVLALAVLAIFQRQEAIRQRDEANLQQRKSTINQLAAQSMYFANREPDLAMLLGIEEENLLNGEKWPIGSMEEVMGAQPCLQTYLRANLYGILSLSMSKNGRFLASGSCTSPRNEECLQGLIRLWDTSDPKSPRPFGQPILGHKNWVYSLAFHPNNKIFASGSTDGIIFWEILGENQIKAITPQNSTHSLDSTHEYTGFGLEFSPNGKLLAVSNSDNTVSLWDVSDPYAPVLIDTPLTGLKAAARLTVFSQDSKILAAGSDIDQIMLWDVSDPYFPVPLGEPFAHNLSIMSMAMSPDGKLLATASYDRSVVVWDISEPGSPRPFGNPLTENYNFVNYLSFSQDGKSLILVGADGDANTFNIANQNLFTRVNRLKTRQSEIIRSAYVNPDQDTLYYGYGNGSIGVWQIVSTGKTCKNTSTGSESLKTSACKIANRHIGRDEWEIYMPDEPFRLTCLDSNDLYFSTTELLHDAIMAEALNDTSSIEFVITQAANLAAKTSDVMLKSTVCSYGTKFGFAKVVLPLCDDAINLAEQQNNTGSFLMHDIRGVARVKSGDLKGAVEDFKQFIEGARKYDEENDQEYYVDDIEKRQEWIKSIEAGNDPFDKDTLNTFDTYGTIKADDNPQKTPDQGSEN